MSISRVNDHVFDSDDGRCIHCGIKSSYMDDSLSLLNDWPKKDRDTNEFKEKHQYLVKCRKLYK